MYMGHTRSLRVYYTAIIYIIIKTKYIVTSKCYRTYLTYCVRLYFFIHNNNILYTKPFYNKT